MASSLLPKSHVEFGSADYWEKFFKKRGDKAFEWYGEYPELCGILSKYVKPTDKILVAGCGNSSLSSDMYDVGYKNLTSVDISDVVIRQMTEKHKQDRPDLLYMKMDLLKMTFSDGEFSVVLDKGTLDALFTEDTEEVVTRVTQMLEEIGRVLRLGGRYVCVSLAQSHILTTVIRHFSELGWLVRVCRQPDPETVEQKEFHMPVFVFVFTKFRKMPNSQPVLELSSFEGSLERVDTVDNLVAMVTEMQHYGLVRQQLNKRNLAGERVSLDLHSPDSASPRYTLHIVDSTRTLGKRYAVFIVPEGRESEWLFSSDEGRQSLAQRADYQRLAVVTLHRDHNYTDMDTIKAELSTKMMELAPPNLGDRQVPFLTLGDDLHQRHLLERGESEFSGKFVVEDVKVEGTTCRRLVFLSSGISQSEALVKKVTEKKKRGGRRVVGTSVDLSNLTSGYYQSVIGGLAFVNNIASKDKQLSLLLIGLGGGGLASYIHQYLPQVELDVVELDPAVVDVARRWFEFKEDKRLRVHIGDGLQHVKDLAEKGIQYDVVVYDVDCKDRSLGISCPPPAFVTPDNLKYVSSILNTTGVFILNLVCRNPSLKTSVLSDIKAAFTTVLAARCEEDVNDVVYALPSHQMALPDTVNESHLVSGELQTALTQLAKTLHNNSKQKIDLCEQLHNLRLT